MPQAPAISVIIPTYKPADYLRQCLLSLAAQTLAASNFEVIVVLNGPRDPYFDFIVQLQKQLPPAMSVRLLYCDIAGVSGARNAGLDEACGAFVAFIDDDDWVSPHYLEHLLAAADEHTVVAASVVAFDDESEQQLTYYMTDAFQRLQPQTTQTLFRARSFLSNACCKLVPRTAIAAERFNQRLALGEDALFMFALSRNVSQVRLSAADAVYYVRYRLSSASRRRYGYGHRVKVALSVSAAYTATWLRSPLRYSLPLYLSRMVATLRKLLQRGYEVTPQPTGKKVPAMVQ